MSIQKKNCKYHGCKNSNRNSPMFSFPVRDQERLAIWIRHSGNTLLESLTNRELQYRYLCSDHFPPSNILKGKIRSRLVSCAIPIEYGTETREEHSDTNPVASPTNRSDSDEEFLENFEYTDLPNDINEDKEENIADSKYADLLMQLKKAQDRIKIQCGIIRTLKQKIRRQASTLTVLKTVVREFGKKKRKSLAKISSSDVFRVVSTNDFDYSTQKMNGQEKNAAAVKTERPISPSCSEDDDGPGLVSQFEKFLEDSDQYLSEDLSNSDDEQTKVGYRKKKLNKKIKVEIQPNEGDFALSSSNDELSPNISKDDTLRHTPEPSTSTDATTDLPPAHNPTQTALSEFHSALIREVQKHPCLYDPLNPAYDNALIKGHIWVEIGKTIGSLETTCQSEWSNIQDSYVTSFNNPSIPYLGPDVRFLDRYITNQEETVIAPIDIKAEDPLECEIKTERDDEEDEQSGASVPVHKKRKIEINLNNTDVTTEMAPKIESIVGNFKNDDVEITKQEASSISQKIKQEESDDVGENCSSQYMLYF